ncbi:MAG: transferase hexapeptide repeat family protein [Desulfobacterales bacterium]|nr:transferase hexapeptide repeat family protein [Desulfobacterales bacterium]
MNNIYEIDGVRPVVDPTSFVHPQAVLIGDVIIGPGCYIGPGASIRGDFGRIIIGSGVNIQDTCVLHCFPEADLVLQDNAHIGHNAVLHGCVVKKNALIGISAVVMDYAVIGENSFVAAMAFVKSRFEVPDNVLAAGIPARVVRKLREDEIKWKSLGTGSYQEMAVRSRNTLKATTPLRAVEPGRKRVNWSKQDVSLP